MPENNSPLGKGSPLNVRVVPRDVDFYYITDGELDNIKVSTFFSEVFLFFVSLMTGAFFSTLITKLISKDLSTEIRIILNTLCWLFLGLSIIFLLCFGISLYIRIKAKKKILEASKVKQKL